MPDEDQPKLKMQSIEATLGINELAEVKRKVEQAKKQEQEQLRKEAAAKEPPSRTAKQPEVKIYPEGQISNRNATASGKSFLILIAEELEGLKKVRI